MINASILNIIEKKSFLTYSFFTIALACFMAAFMPELSFEGDVHWWREWALYIHENGFSKAYQSDTLNYQPGLLYVLQIWAYLSKPFYADGIIILKRLFFVFDVGAVLLVALVIRKFGSSMYWSWIILLNPAFLYNTFLWGQCDSLYMFFCFLCIVFVLYNKPYFAIAAIAFAIMMKPQAIFMGPLLLIVYSGWLKEKPLRIFYSTLTFILSLLVLSIPFILQGDFNKLIQISFGAIDRIPSVSMHAFNIWYLLMPGQDLVWVPDSNLFLGLSLKIWGLLMFTMALIFVLKPFAIFFKRSFFTDGNSKRYGATILLATVVVNLVFYYFNTQMHERYIHATILFAGTYAIIRKEFLPFILLSIAYFLSLDILMFHCRFPEAVYKAFIPYNPIFISFLILFSLILSTKQLYRDFSLLKLK